jgi:uncharacterized protein (UPF0276 family)
MPSPAEAEEQERYLGWLVGACPLPTAGPWATLAPALARFAEALRAKRADELAAALPLSHRLAPSLRGAYLRFLARDPAPASPPGPLTPGLTEALRSDAALIGHLKQVGPAYAADLLRFERARAATRRDGQPRRVVSPFPIPALAAQIARGLLPQDAPAAPCDLLLTEGPGPILPAAGPPIPAPVGRPRVGISLRRTWIPDLLRLPVDEAPEVLEVIPDHFFGDADRLRPLAERYPIVLHDTDLSLATPGPLDGAHLAALSAVVEASGARCLSAHLALTRSPGGRALGHLAPLPRSPAALHALRDKASQLRDSLGCPVLLENAATPFVPPGSLPEGEFLHALVEGDRVGLLVDLSNLLVDHRNGGPAPEARLADWPLQAARQIHLAGGRQGREAWIDSHDRPVDPAAYALLPLLTQTAPIAWVVVERDARLPPLAALIDEARAAIPAWEPR